MSIMLFMVGVLRLYFLSSISPFMMFCWFSSLSLVMMMKRGFVPLMCPFMWFAAVMMLLSVDSISVSNNTLWILNCCIRPASGNR